MATVFVATVEHVVTRRQRSSGVAGVVPPSADGRRREPVEEDAARWSGNGDVATAADSR